MRVFERLACLILCICIILSGCANENDVPIQSDDSNTYTQAEKQKKSPHQPLQTNVLAQTSLGASKGELISLPAVGLNNVVVVAKEYSISANKVENNHAIYLLGDYRYQHNSLHDGYIALELGDRIIFYDLGNRSLEDKIFLCDLDADGKDEIILHQVFDNFGSVGQYISRVFRIEDNIVEITCVEADNTGYRCEAMANHQFRVFNEFTANSDIFDISDVYPAEFFDETGKLTKEIEIFYSSFLKFEPKDIDGDGLFEIECTQVLYFDYHRNFVGYARTVIKLNKETQQFDIVQTKYQKDYFED